MSKRRSLVINEKTIREAWFATVGDVPLWFFCTRFVVPDLKWLVRAYGRAYRSERRAWDADVWRKDSNMCGVFSMNASTLLNDFWQAQEKHKDDEGTRVLMGVLVFMPVGWQGKLLDQADMFSAEGHVANWTIKADYSEGGGTPGAVGRLRLHVQGLEPQALGTAADPLFEIKDRVETPYLGIAV